MVRFASLKLKGDYFMGEDSRHPICATELISRNVPLGKLGTVALHG